MYIIYKVNCNSGINSDNIKIEIDNICNRIGEARDYIHNFDYVFINNEKCIINKIIEDKPTVKDDDGYYLVRNSNIENRVDVYKKKTKLVEGYLYNSYEIKIEKVVFFEIQFFDKTIDENKVRDTCSIFTKEVRPNLIKPYELPPDVLTELKEKLRQKNMEKEKKE
tara:strand:- start:64 stop:561 length:498 start_codon:yes stop_codon:yes gene_type:complete